MLTYHRGDEIPVWQPRWTVNGDTEDYSDGFTFTVTLTKGSTTETPSPTVTGVDGGANVAWAAGDLDITPGRWTAKLRVRDGSDLDLTISQEILIK